MAYDPIGANVPMIATSLPVVASFTPESNGGTGSGEDSSQASENVEKKGVVQSDLSKLGPYVMAQWQIAKYHRRQSGIEERLLTCLRDVNGVYSDTEAKLIQELYQPDIFYPLSNVKRRACNAIIRQIFVDSSFYALNPSPVPDISPDDAMKLAERAIRDYVAVRISEFVDQGLPINIAQELAFRTPPDPDALKAYVESIRDEQDEERKALAKRKVDRMSKKIADQRVDGGYNKAFMTLADYAAVFGTAVFKGPSRRLKDRVKFGPNGCVLEQVEVFEYTAIHPLDCYPVKGARDVQNSDFYCRARYTPRDLSEMLDLGEENGYFPSAIRRILTMFPNGGYTLIEPTDVERYRLENDGAVGNLTTTTIDVIEGWCSVKGSVLKATGVVVDSELKPLSDDRYYDVNCTVCAGETLHCVVTDKRLGRPLYKCVFFDEPGSWWGSSPVEKMHPCVREYNADKRAKCVNVANCSGPMSFINTAKMLPGQSFRHRPYAVYTWHDPVGMGQPPARLFQAASNIMEINADLEAIEKQIDHVTGIMSASHMDDTAASAGRTYNGMLLLIQAQQKGANDVVLSMWEDVGRPALLYQYRYNMLFDPDESLKGDCEVDAGGLLAILTREQNRAALESFLTLVVSNPVVQAKIGDAGLLELLKTYIKTLDGINPNIIPSPEEYERRAKLAQITAQVTAAIPPVGAGGSQSQPPPSAMPVPQTANVVSEKTGVRNQPVEM